jgi:hypothetical protein
MEKCQYCKISIEKEKLDLHELYCVSNFNINNNNLIPCEICNNFIEFDKYNNHISQCGLFSTIFNSSQLLQNSNNILNNTHIPPNIHNILPFFYNSSIESSENNTNSTESNVELPTLPIIEPLPTLPIIEPLPTLPIIEPLPTLPIIEPLPTLPIIEPLPSNNTDISQQLYNNINFIMNTLNNITDNNYESLSQLDDNNETCGCNIDEKSEKIECKENEKCIICYEEFNKMNKLKCKHLFCYECLEEWLKENKKCPVCLIEL